MKYLHLGLSFALSLGQIVAKVSAQANTASPTSTAPVPQSTACGDIINATESGGMVTTLYSLNLRLTKI